MRSISELWNRPRSPLFSLTLILPSLLIILALIVYPLVFSLVISFGKVGANFRNYQFVGFANYLAVLLNREIWHALLLTLEWILGVTVILMFVGMAGALLLNTGLRGQSIFRTLLLIPWAVPPVANGIIWLSILNKNYGALNGLLYQIGIIRDYSIGWLETPTLAMASVIVAQVWKWSPFITLMILASLQSIPEELYESAKIDGAGFIRRFAYLTLPLLMPTLLLLTLLNLVWALNAFDLIYALTQGGPGNATKVIAYYIWKQTFSAAADFGGGAALSYIILLISIGITFFYARVSRAKRVEY
ncbi:MAG: sugar ABC transporter permease [Spirochaetia bacterium]|jgi:ABC-type sugar transport system permease subunit